MDPPNPQRPANYCFVKELQEKHGLPPVLPPGFIEDTARRLMATKTGGSTTATTTTERDPPPALIRSLQVLFAPHRSNSETANTDATTTSQSLNDTITDTVPAAVLESSTTVSTEATQRAPDASTNPKITDITFRVGEVQVHFMNDTVATAQTVEEFNNYLYNHYANDFLVVSSHHPTTAATFGDENMNWFGFLTDCSGIKLTGGFFRKSISSYFEFIEEWGGIRRLQTNIRYVEDP